MKQEMLFVFVTAEARVMARLSDGSIVDVTEHCDLLPRRTCDAHDTGARTAPVKLAA